MFLVMRIKAVAVFLSVWHQASSYWNCQIEININYTIFDYSIRVYSCPEVSCADIGFSLTDDIEERIKTKCLCGNKKQCGKRSTQQFCDSLAKVDLLNNAIYLPHSNKQDFNTSGIFYNKHLNTNMVWFPETVCHGRKPIYNGPVDVLTFQGHDTRKVLLAKGSSQFSLQLVEKIRLCRQEAWTTDKDGVLAVEVNRNLPYTIDESKLKHLPKLRGDLKIICELFPETADQTERLTYLQDTQILLLIGVGVYLFWVILTFTVTCVINYRALKRERATGLALLRCLSSTLSSHYIYVKKGDKMAVEAVDESLVIENSIYRG